MKKEVLEKIFNARKNLIIEGDIESGKTANVLFPVVEDIIEKKENIFILDAKEEYINRYYEKLKSNNYNIVILNLKDMDKSEGWNPLEYPYTLYKNGNKDKAQEHLENISRAIFYDDSNSDPYWSLTASDFFVGIALALFEDGKEDEVNMNSIYEMFCGIDQKVTNSNYLTDYFKTKNPNSKSYVFASATVFAPKDTSASIMSVARQKIRMFFSNEKLSQIMSKSTFKYEKIKENPTAIIFIARDGNLPINSYVSMFLEQLYMVINEINSKNKFNFILDNIDVLDKCTNLVNILETSTSRGIKVYIATRYLKEFENKYGNYAIKLCDILSIENKKLSLTINQEKETYEKNFETIDKIDGNVEYPKLNETIIKTFNYKKIADIAREKRENNFLNDFSKELNKNVKKKINELEKELDETKK